MGRRSQEEEVKIAALRNSETFSLLSATEMVEQIEVFLKHGLIMLFLKMSVSHPTLLLVVKAWILH